MAREDALAAVAARATKTPQSERADARQVRNNAGGYTFAVTREARLNRFLTLGVESGTYYVNARDLAVENAAVVRDMAENDTLALVRAIVDVSESGRAPKQKPALYALAAATAYGDLDGKRAAADALPRVARTGTALRVYLNYARKMRGGGRVLNRALCSWLTADTERTAYQFAKYRNREGWSNSALLRTARPKPADAAQDRLFRWALGYDPDWDGAGLRVIEGLQRAKRARPGEVAGVVREYGLVREMVPEEHLSRPDVWEALFDAGMPQTALLRNLPRLTNAGVLAQTGSEWTQRACDQLADPERLKRARVHPIAVLLAHKTYAQGHGDRGKSTWVPVPRVIDALDDAFYAAFGSVEKTGKATLLALDVSGSMSNYCVPDSSLTAREASAAMALVTARAEPEHQIVGFTGRGYSAWGRPRSSSPELTELAISPKQRLADAVRTVSDLPFGRTDCALPMTWATEHGLRVDTFVVYTDNETWHGSVHPHQALNEYRKRVNPAARLAVVALSATDFTIADPSDSGQLDVSGFDAATPQLLSDFAVGRV